VGSYHNDKYVEGSEELDEERIQQIVHRYIRPSVVLTCHMIAMHMPGCPSVGVIEIKGLERPYRVVRDIANLKQDQVFVRHGSVTAQASPEEIRRMQEETEQRRRALKLIEAAETHLNLGNFEDAAEVYTQAIKATPTAELFQDRGRAYRRWVEERSPSWDLRKELQKRAFKDLSDAICLANAGELEKKARFERLRVYNLAFEEYEALKEDVEWLKNNTEGTEQGEVIYLEYAAYEGNVGFSRDEPDEVLTAMDRATHLGYREPGVYDLRAHANFYLHNYGLALEDIDEATKFTTRLDEQVDRLGFRAIIQMRMRRRVSGKTRIERHFGPIVQAIREIVGEDFWEQCEYIGRHGVLCWTFEENG
jgi:hypothetical protein